MLTGPDRVLQQRLYSYVDADTYLHQRRNFGERFQVALGIRSIPTYVKQSVHVFSSMRVQLG